MINKSNVLIAGCGAVGSELAQQLIRANCEVWGLRRNVSKLPQGVHPITADLTQANGLGEWPKNIDYVVYSASASGRTTAQYQQAYITGLKHVLSRLVKESYEPKRVFFTSSTAVYHQNQGEIVDEQSDTHPETFNGKIMLEAEALLTSSPFPNTSVRFGGIYGSGRNRLVHRVKQGEGCSATPVIYSNRIHQTDCAGIIKHLIQQDKNNQPIDSLYLGVDHEPAPIHEVIQWLGHELNVELNNTIPAPPRGSKRCSNARICNTGYTFVYPNYRMGYQRLLEEQN